MVFIRKYIRFLYILFLPVFLFIVYQSLQNKHAHFYSNGVVVHSHPLNRNDGNPVKNHNHTNAEIYLYQILSFDYFSHTGELHLETGAISFPEINFVAKEQSHFDVWLCNYDTRDPPATQS